MFYSNRSYDNGTDYTTQSKEFQYLLKISDELNQRIDKVKDGNPIEVPSPQKLNMNMNQDIEETDEEDDEFKLKNENTVLKYEYRKIKEELESKDKEMRKRDQELMGAYNKLS